MRGNLAIFAAGTLTAGAAYLMYGNKVGAPSGGNPAECPVPVQKIGEDLLGMLDKKPEMAATLIRLAWHDAGTYKAADNSGSANTASIRFFPECEHGANAGLEHARLFLHPLREKYGKDVSHPDLYTLSSCVAIEQMGGPHIEWKWGRSVAGNGEACNKDTGRLPDAAQGAQHIRDVFGRMGFSEKETVALIGAHAVGECHGDRSGFSGAWKHDKHFFDNGFFRGLFDEKWVKSKSTAGLDQYTDETTKTLMMLPADLAVRDDPAFSKIAKGYAADNDLFCKDFASAYQKLMELGQKDLKAAPAFKMPQ